MLSSQIGHAMVVATEQVFLRSKPCWYHSFGGHQRMLRIKVGAGKATYFRGTQSTDLIVFGKKMVESKMTAEKSDWLSYKEIRTRHYFGGDVCLLNLLSHTVCHEVAHLVQFYRGGRRYGSVHNAMFYQALDELHEQGKAEQVKQYLASELWSKNIDLKQLDELNQTTTQPSRMYFKGQPIWFVHQGQRIDAIVVRVNRKTVSAKPKNASGRLAYWRIPFGLIESE